MVFLKSSPLINVDPVLSGKFTTQASVSCTYKRLLTGSCFAVVHRNRKSNIFVFFRNDVDNSKLIMPAKQRRIALMGFRSVGKSSLTIQFVENHFVDSYDPTIENTFQKTVKVGGQEYELQLIDTAGQDEYSILPQSYFVNIDGYILVYSVNSQKSYDVITFVYDKLLDMLGNKNLPVVLVGNKSDLDMEREVPTDVGRRTAEKWKVPFLETSAKENQAVSKVFDQMVLTIEKASGNVQEKNGCVVS